AYSPRSSSMACFYSAMLAWNPTAVDKRNTSPKSCPRLVIYMSLDRDLDGDPFRVDLFRCRDAAQVIASYAGVHTVEPWTHLPKIDQLVFKTLFISICHQMNWDVLQSAMADWLLPDAGDRLGELANTSPKEISDLLRHYPKQERVRAVERSRMLRGTAEQLSVLLKAGGRLRRLLEAPVLEGQSGFYDTIAAIPAYTGDPFDKKARVLAHDLYREGIVNFSDPENLKPAVEYHLIRLYLRSGRVVPASESVRDELLGERRPARPRLVKLLRGAVDMAMRQTALYSGIDVATLNYLEWQIGRSICVEELGPELVDFHCEAPAPADMPDDVRALATCRCPFAGFCGSLNDPGYGWFREPQFQKAIY
ncbi:hypothetical protein O4H52_22260, partial [Sphingomonadaceae bacterium G21617-S1]|nr:hypothetical protein [Sphingomonadaceae bacterium G21617-S1]